MFRLNLAGYKNFCTYLENVKIPEQIQNVLSQYLALEGPAGLVILVLAIPKGTDGREGKHTERLFVKGYKFEKKSQSSSFWRILEVKSGMSESATLLRLAQEASADSVLLVTSKGSPKDRLSTLLFPRGEKHISTDSCVGFFLL
jgi:hypothetical protein